MALPMLIILPFLGSCADILETDSNRLAFEDENKLNSPDDSLYSVMGILSQLQKVADRYVILGELRGDLMITSENASVSLKEINGFNVSSENAYLDKSDYYHIINNCNYAITRMDTSIAIRNEKVMLPEFAAIKAIRSWTYLQLAQIYGRVTYIEKPVLDYEASIAAYPVIGPDELVPLLIADLEPYLNVRKLYYGYIDGQNSAQFFIPIAMLLGDLYLYQNNYDAAAAMYHKLITENQYIISLNYASYWDSNNRERATEAHVSAYGSEVISKIAFSAGANGFHSNLVNTTYSNAASFLPAPAFVEDMSLKLHFHANQLGFPVSDYFEGDLRGCIRHVSSRINVGDAYEHTGNGEQEVLIRKFLNASVAESGMPDSVNNPLLDHAHILTTIPVYRHPHLYLRFAEAVNRAGKPSFAFAVLKYGLNETTIPTVVNPAELEGGESYLNFRLFTNNVGTAARGRGLGVLRDQTEFVIPALPALPDSIDWVESRILEEMASETAFEGNRFFDLLRISRHRADHPAFMAKKVSLKYGDRQAEMKAKLMNLDAWFIK
jgi:tetratricopeptide (TPR) repeat protein